MAEDIKTEHPGTDQIEAWKKKYGGVYEIDIEGYTCWMHPPNIETFKHAFTSLQISEIDFQNAIINNCWLKGDPVIREDEDYFNALCTQIDALIDIPDYRIEQKETSYSVEIQGLRCELRKPTREDIRVAQMKNIRNQPFETNINLLKKIWIEGDEEIQKKANYYMALLLAVSELETQKIATIKKL